MKGKLIGLLALAGTMAATSVSANETISVSGSTSVTEVMEVLAETYHSLHKNTFIEVQGTGSSAGIKAAKNGTSMFGMASRELKTSEKEDALKETVIARDGIAIVVNSGNTINDLTKEEIAAIYRGDITNWADVGGESKPIVVVTRDTASGTRGAFEDIMNLKRKVNGISVSSISQRAQVANGNGVVKTIVANNPFAIGFISLGSVDKSLKAVKVDGHAPSVAAVQAGTYNVARPFLILHKDNKMTDTGRAFLNWATSEEGQKIVSQQGYIAIN
ncbi:phosphate ABC transporter substrate-binding protein [Parasalinivibrio latis]|uniref:phosphate ABC transporter substrate-binding protein n=1 Tax=Parasalinivibrio latis TaxID=2952610 RepID=UPI0030DE021A